MNKPHTKAELEQIIQELEREKMNFAQTVIRDEERYRTIFEYTGNATILIAEDTTILLANSNFAKLTGCTREEIEGKISWTAFIVPEDLEMMKQFHNRRREKNDPVPNSYEFRLRSRTGEIRDISLSVALISGTKESVASCMDVTERNRAMAALRQSEKKYRNILETMEESYFETDLKGNYTFVNNALCRILGYPPEDLIGMNYKSRITPEALKQIPEIRRSVSVTGASQNTVVAEVIGKDGSRRNMEFSISLLRGQTGAQEGFRAIGRDVTEKIEAQQDLMKKEELYRTIFEHTATANMIVSENTTILMVNSNFENLSGYARHEVENKMSWTQFVVAEDLEKMTKRHVQRRTEPEVVPYSYEFRGIIKSGEIRNLFISVAMIPGTKNSIVSLMDMTDRQKAQDALRQSEERFRDMARLLPETVFETNATGNIVFVNESALDKFGFTHEDLDHGLSFLDVVAPQDHERVLQNFQKLIQGEQSGLNEYLARKKDGTLFPALVHSTPIIKDGQPSGARGFLMDISEKKAIEGQLLRAQKMEAIGTLAGGIAHDFNNLLMGILGNLSMLLMDLDEAHPFHERLKTMEEYVQRGSNLTRQLLGFARGGKYEVRTTNLGKFALRSAEVFGRTKKDITIHHKTTHDLWHVDVDRGQMDQVLLNLFVNAWQAMPSGGNLLISLENVELNSAYVATFDVQPGKFVKLTVTDTGIGMDENTKAHVFEPFFSTKERGRGTGLGLASVYGIIKHHGGFIKLESEKGSGTSFIIYLPASEKKMEAELVKDSKLYKGRETILLIDDEDMMVDVGTQMLEGLGYKVLAAEGGRQGIAVFESNKEQIDLVILDMIMPDLGGKETFQALLKLKPSVKALLSSGYSQDGQAQEIMDEGCKGFIQKPFTITELSRKVREILDKS